MSKEEIFTGERFVPGIDDDEITIEHYQRYETILELVKDKVVVDAACGEGYGTSIIGSVAKNVVGLDISEDAVSRATETYSRENVSYQVGDISNLPFENNSVEVFVSFETIEHVDAELQKKFVDEVSRVLKEDGIFIISSPNKEIYSDLFDYHNEFHIHEMYKTEFVELLRNKFENVKLFNQFWEVSCIIDNDNNLKGNALFKKKCGTRESDGKYYIAIASKKNIDNIELQSTYVKDGTTYLKSVSRILQLQEEVEERNVHNKELDEHIEKLDNEIVVRDKHIEKLDNDIVDRDQSIENLNNDLMDKDENIRELTVELEKKIHLL